MPCNSPASRSATPTSWPPPGAALHARLEAAIAGSTIRGDGTVGLEGDYPVNGAVTFTRLDLARLRAWTPGPAVLPGVTGFAEGGVRISGSALRPEAMEGELQLARLEIAPADTAGPAASLALHNSAPIVVAIAGSQLTLRSVRLAGRATDIAIAGKIDLRGASLLDLRVNGQVDAEAVHELDPDFTASGVVEADATIRGTPAPQITGRVQFQKAAFNLADFPNGVSNANGVILFTGSRHHPESRERPAAARWNSPALPAITAAASSIACSARAPRAGALSRRREHGGQRQPEPDRHADRSMLSGTVTVRRTGFNPQSDFSSLIARSAEPVRNPAARAGRPGPA